MIKKTPYEKEQIKKAKSAYKKEAASNHNSIIKPTAEKKNVILTGKMEGENLLSLDHPVHYDYLYVIDNGLDSYKVIKSSIKGTVSDLMKDQNTSLVFNCNLAARNLF